MSAAARLEAGALAAELGCEVTPHPLRTGVFEARDPWPGVWLLAGTSQEIRAEAARIAAGHGKLRTAPRRATRSSARAPAPG
jgi:hypothetical protein